jgi:hypothetical protein
LMEALLAPADAVLIVGHRGAQNCVQLGLKQHREAMPT